MKREEVLFEEAELDADEAALIQGEPDADAGRLIPHEDVVAWVKTWGTGDEKSIPDSWMTKAWRALAEANFPSAHSGEYRNPDHKAGTIFQMELHRHFANSEPYDLDPGMHRGERGLGWFCGSVVVERGVLGTSPRMTGCGQGCWVT